MFYNANTLYKKLTYISKLVLVLSMFSNSQTVISIQLSKEYIDKTAENSINTIIPLLVNDSHLCVHYKKDDIVPKLIEIYERVYNFPVLVSDGLNEVMLDSCGSVICFETSVSVSCNEMLVVRGVYRSVVLVVSVVTSSVRECLAAAEWRRVIVVSLSDGSVWRLSDERRLLPFSITQALPLHKTDLQGATLTAAVFHYVPFIIFKNKNGTDLAELDGIEVLLLRELAAMMNATVKVLECDGWGAKLPNGTWAGGIVQPMVEGTADLAFANIWQILSDYHQLFDLSPSLTKIKMAFLVRRPNQIDLRWNSFFTIFQRQVWLALFASYFIVVAFYCVGVRVGLQNTDGRWSSCFLVIFGYFVSSYFTGERGCNTRYTLTSWAVFSLLFTTALSSGIFTRLSVPAFEERVDTLQQLVEGQYYWTVPYYRDFNTDIDLVESIFDLEKILQSCIANRKWKRYQCRFVLKTDVRSAVSFTISLIRFLDFYRQNQMVKFMITLKIKFDQHYQLAQYRKTAENKWARKFEKTYKYLDTIESMKEIKHSQKITLPVQRYGNDFVVIDNFELNGNEALTGYRMSAEEVTSAHVAFAIQKNSPLFEQLSVATLAILEAGLMYRWTEDVFRRWPQYNTRHLLVERDMPTFSEPKRLSQIQLRPVFYLLLGGLVLSTIVFVFEVLGS